MLILADISPLTHVSVTYQVFDDPSLPPEFRLPQFNGTMEPYRDCNGSLLPPEPVSETFPIPSGAPIFLPIFLVRARVDKDKPSTSDLPAV
jgi:hypothetical protein